MGCQETVDAMATPEKKFNHENNEAPATGDGSSTSDQPESPLSSAGSTSRTSPQNTTDSEAPVLTPVTNDQPDVECRKRKADDEVTADTEVALSGDPESTTEIKRAKLDEGEEKPKSPVNGTESIGAKGGLENLSTVHNTEQNPVQDNETSVDLSIKSLETSQDSDISKSHSDLSEEAKSEECKPADRSPGDSDKENTDVPIDLSLGVKGNSSSAEVVVSLPSEGSTKPLVNGFKEMTPEQLKERRHLVKRLQDELRNEEAKLVLLKKIRQSQLLQHLHDAAPSTKTLSSSSSLASKIPQSGPPPLIKGTDEASLHRHQHGSQHMSQTSKIMGSQHGHNRSTTQGIQSHGPPPLIMAPTARGQSQLHHKSQQPMVSTSRNSSHSTHSQVHSQPEQTPAQRQAAAKLALRKQLEKTLLQIPPPKPPPPEMNFIPNLAGNDFMLLVGLEEVVKFIVEFDAHTKDEKALEVKYVFNPFVCVQCGTDFTPVWKRDKPGSKNVICEQCVTTNQKKALKQEHTNRLKSAFVKALQQEQEIEQRMQAQTSSSHRSSKERSSERDREREHSSHREELEPRPSRSAHGHSVHTHMSHHSSSPSSTNPVNLSTNFKATNEQIRQHQNLIQAHQAQLCGAALTGRAPAFNPRLMFQFSPQHLASSSSKADLHRQYLLDMIPPRSLPGSNALWRT